MKFEIGPGAPSEVTLFDLEVIDSGETVALNVNGVMVMFFNKNSMTVDFAKVLDTDGKMPFPVADDGYLEVER